MLVTSFALSFGMEEANDDELDASIVASVPSNSIISRPRNPFEFARCFPWRTTLLPACTP